MIELLRRLVTHGVKLVLNVASSLTGCSRRFSNTRMGFTMGSTVRNMVLVIVGGRARSIDGNVAGHRSCYDVLVQ